MNDDIDYEHEDSLTFEEVLEILEEELLALGDLDNPYRPLDFNDTDQGYEEET